MAKRRVFLAIELPPEIINGLKDVQGELRKAFPSARMANPAGMHLTVKFIGYAAEEDLLLISEVARRVAGATRPFIVLISGFGGFPSITRPRVLWAGAKDGGESAVMSAQLDKELTVIGVKAETRPYKPHITLARINKPAVTPVNQSLRAAKQSENIGTARAEKLILFESHLKRSGAEYEAIEEFGFCLDTNTCL